MTDNKGVIFPFLIAFFSATLFSSMDAYYPAMPLIASQYHLSPNMIQLTTTSWMLGGILLIPFMGPLSDAVGRRPMMIFGASALTFGSWLIMFTHQFSWLLVGRFCQGVTLAPMLVSGYAAVNEYFGKIEAIRVMAKISALSLVAPGLAPLFGGIWASHLSWRLLFGLIGGMSFINMLLFVRYMPETLAIEHRQALHLGRSISGYAELMYQPRFMTGLLLCFLPRFGFVVWLVTSSFIMVDLFHLSPIGYGWVQALSFSLFVVGSVVVNRFSSVTRNQQLLIMARLALGAGSFIAVVSAWLAPHSLWALLSGVVIYFFGMGINEPIMLRLTLDQSDGRMGLRTSLVSFTRVGFGLLGSGLSSLFYQQTSLSVTRFMLISFGLLLCISLLQSYWSKANSRTL